MFGGEDADEISGSAGDDEVYGGDGGDLVFGEGGSDDLYGGLGDESIFGTDGVAGNDALDGGSHTVADACASDVGDVESDCEA